MKKNKKNPKIGILFRAFRKFETHTTMKITHTLLKKESHKKKLKVLKDFVQRANKLGQKSELPLSIHVTLNMPLPLLYLLFLL